MSGDCLHRIAPTVERRPGNALNIEIGTPLPRCLLKAPSHWPETGPSAVRWIGSGGSPLVLGFCNKDCPVRSGSLFETR